MSYTRADNGFPVLVKLNDSNFAKKKMNSKLDNYLPKRSRTLSFCQIEGYEEAKAC